MVYSWISDYFLYFDSSVINDFISLIMVDVNYCIISFMIDMKFLILCVLHKNKFIILTRSILYLYWYTSIDWLTKNHHKYFPWFIVSSHISLFIRQSKQTSPAHTHSIIQINLLGLFLTSTSQCRVQMEGRKMFTRGF